MAISSSGGSGKQKSNRDKMRASFMKAHDIERTTGQCAVCYRIITIESRKSRYNHICKF